MSYIEREVERSVPELQIGRLLSRAEIRHILKQRTHYAEHKFKYTKQDYLRYLQYENKLFRLLMLRAQRRSDLSEDDIESIRRRCIYRINAIYNVALRNYGSDRQLWLLSFDFAKRYSERISRAKFLKALLLHPHWTEAWIEAATYEYEWNRNPSNARLLYQRAVALNPKSSVLFLRFFAMEIEVITQHYALNKDRISNEDNIDDKSDGDDDGDGDIDWRTELNKMQSNHKRAKMFDKWMLSVYSEMQLPKLIFRHCIANIDSKQRCAVLKAMVLSIPAQKKSSPDEEPSLDDDLLSKFSELSDYMFDYLESNYFSDPQIVELLARKNLQKNSHSLPPSKALELSGCAVFERALLAMVKQLPKKKRNVDPETMKRMESKSRIGMLTRYVDYLHSRQQYYIEMRQKLSDSLADSDFDDGDRKMADNTQMYDSVMDYLVALSLRSYQTLSDLSSMTPQLYRMWILLLSKINKMEECFDLVAKATKQFSTDAQLWQLYSELYLRRYAIDSNNDKLYRRAMAALKKGIQCVDIKNAPILWSAIIEIVLCKLANVTETGQKTQQLSIVHRIFKECIHCCPKDNQLKRQYLEWVSLQCDKQSILDVLHWFENETTNCTPQTYLLLIRIYETIMLSNDGSKLSTNGCDRIKKIFERCMIDHGKDNADVWVWYLQWARQRLILSKSSQIYQRAMRTLPSKQAQEFLLKTNAE